MNATQTTDMTVANTILAQLGGNRFRAMTGARNFVGSADTLSFHVSGKGKNGSVTAMRVTLNPLDLYTVTALRIRGTKVTEVEVVDGVYFDQLQNVFTSMTGLYTRL